MPDTFYKPLEHTGDLGVEVWGGSLSQLFEHASLALTDTLVQLSSIQTKEKIIWKKSASSIEVLFIEQLQEILYYFDAKEMVFSKFEIKLEDANTLKCTAHGEKFDRQKHPFKTELKAITYHQLKIWEDKDRWKARVIFDV